MRTKIKTSSQGLDVRAIAGTYVVLLAMNCPAAYRKGLLGFSILRTDLSNGETAWLRGGKHFDLPASAEGQDVSSRLNPIQKFHWGDYTTKAGRTYTYTIHVREGTPAALKTREKISLRVTCEKPEKVGASGHQVHFNRSAAASQAYITKFGDRDPDDVGQEAKTWLSRGLEEALIQYIDDAKAGETLHLFVYEFEKESFLTALQRAKKRGVTLEILYDAIIKNVKNKKTGIIKKEGPSLKSVPAIKQFGLDAKGICVGREGKGINISHNKFAVLTGKNGKPISVWTGSTNWTDNGVYCQTNVGHVIASPALAQTYLDWHQKVWADPGLSAADSRTAVLGLTQLPPKTNATGAYLVLSPRKTIEAVTQCAQRVQSAKKLVCFTAPFAMHDDLENALATAPAQVFGLLNTENCVGDGMHKAPNTQLASAAALDKMTALEIWQEEGHQESMFHSGVFIHTKILLVDPLSNFPLVITGSANFSNNSSKNNDENQLYIFGETEVADIYLGEFMRMFDHYFFRSHMKKVNAAKKKKTKLPKKTFLSPDDGWTKDFFSKGPRQAERLAFF